MLCKIARVLKLPCVGGSAAHYINHPTLWAGDSGDITATHKTVLVITGQAKRGIFTQ